MTPNPILKVLSTLRSAKVRHLLMGGQACVLYGAAEFSRDADVLLPSDEANLRRLNEALSKLKAECIAVPSLARETLERGHAVRFRCHESEAEGMRLDVMSVLRGVDSFEEVWNRRTTVKTESGEELDILALEDLVAAKQTQRDKDWPMLRRLIEAHYAENVSEPSNAQIEFWLRESRTPEMLIELCSRFPGAAKKVAEIRPLLKTVMAGEIDRIEAELKQEEEQERMLDKDYWNPLKAELEQLRHARAREKRGKDSD